MTKSIETLLSDFWGILSAIGLDTDSLKFSTYLTQAGIDTAWNYFMLLGISMTIVYFLIEMNQKLGLEGRDLTLKSAFAPFLKLMIAIGVLAKGGDIISAILNFYNKLLDDVSSWGLLAVPNMATYVPQGETQTIQDVIAAHPDLLKGNLWINAFFHIAFLCIYLTSTLVIIIWWYKCLSFKLELLLRIIISPIALADIYSGANANAIRWLKGFLSLALYGSCFILIPRLSGAVGIETIYNAIVKIITDGINVWAIFRALALCLVIPIAALGTMSLAKQATKEAIGA